MIDLLCKIIEWIFSWLKGKFASPLNMNVTDLYYQEMNNRHDDSIVVITSYPTRYFATLQLTNNGDSDVYIKGITLIINEIEKHETKEKMPIHLQPRQFIEYNIIFPTKKHTQVVKSGRFRIEITPSVGRKAITLGSFPLKN
jgi:hypothetical protein